MINLEDASKVVTVLRCACDDGSDCGTCEAIALCHGMREEVIWMNYKPAFEQITFDTVGRRAEFGCIG